MSFDNATITWGAKQLAAMVKNGRIKFDNIIQRSYVWERQRKSLFVHSMCVGFPIPPVYAKRFSDDTEKKNNNFYDLLDGKQRITTVAQFVNNELVLSEDVPDVTYYDELEDRERTTNISGKSFRELPEGLQEKVKNARISVVYFDNLNKHEEKELFKRLNNGKPLTAKNKMLAACKDINGILEIGKHPMFEDMLTEKAKESKNQVTIIMKAWMMLNKPLDTICFDSKVFHPVVENTVISEEENKQLQDVFDLMMNTHTILEEKDKKTAKKMYRETHFISLIPFFKDALKNDISDEEMAEWVFDFFYTDSRKTSKSNKYNEFAKNGVNKTESILARYDALSESYNEWFPEDEEEIEQAESVSGDVVEYESDTSDFEEVEQITFM